MLTRVRSYVSKENYDEIRKLATYPSSATFDSSVTELIRKFKEMKNEVSEK